MLAPSLDLLTCFDFDLCLTPKLEECLPPFDNLTCSIEELYIFKKKMKKKATNAVVVDDIKQETKLNKS